MHRSAAVLVLIACSACSDSGSLETCQHHGKVYPPGETFPAGDGCNTCSCGANRAVLCSTKKCSDGGPAPDRQPTDGGAGRLSCHQKAFPVAIDRSCGQDADCIAVEHLASCCGTKAAVGINAREKARFDPAEKECAATYPGCGCPTGPTTTDDGSQLSWGEQAAVACLKGLCTTYVKGCGQPCSAGRQCLSCATKTDRYAVCSTNCTVDGDCKNSALPRCQSGELGYKLCTATSVVCGK
jgi:hypothetical protein